MSRTQAPPGQWTALGMLGSILGATACLVGCATELSALGRPHTAPAGLLIGLAAGFGAGLAALSFAAVRLSRRLRVRRDAVPTAAGTGDVARAGGVAGDVARAGAGGVAGDGAGDVARAGAGDVARAGAGDVARAGAAPRTLPARIRRAVVLRVLGVVAVVAVILTIPATVYLHGQTVRTADTQHGLAVRATVVRVLQDEHDTTHDSWTTYNYEVRLASPAGGVTRTLAHDPTRDSQRFFAGDQVGVVVDPGQPGYAEFPGLPVANPAWYLLAVVVLAVLILAGAGIAWGGRRRRRAGQEPGAAKAS